MATTSELQRACDAWGITIASEHRGVDYDSEPKYPRDRWSCTLSFEGKNATFEFFTGIGNRKVETWAKAIGPGKWNTSRGVVVGYKGAIAAQILRTVDPSAADVLSCLLLDASACDTTFADWASDSGMNADSISDLNTYLKCQENGTKVRRLLGPKVLEQLQGKEH